MDVHPTKHGIFIGIDPYPYLDVDSIPLVSPHLMVSNLVYPHLIGVDPYPSDSLLDVLSPQHLRPDRSTSARSAPRRSSFASSGSTKIWEISDSMDGLRENLQETMVFTIKYRAFRLKFSHHPILWLIKLETPVEFTHILMEMVFGDSMETTWFGDYMEIIWWLYDDYCVSI